MPFWEISQLGRHLLPVSSTHYPSASNSRTIPDLLFTTHANICSHSTDTEKPISAGFYRLEPGTPLVYTYTYHEMKIIISGDFTIADEAGNKVTASAGDVFYFPKGSVITFTSEKGGLAFYTGQRAEGAA